MASMTGEEGMFNRGGLIDAVDLSLPNLPPRLEGLRIIHLSDLHIQRKRARYNQITDCLRGLRADVALLTGDYITDPGDEPVSTDVMREICQVLDTPLGVYGVFGNHDTRDLRQRFNDLPVHWLDNACHRPDPNLPLELMGFETDATRWPDTLDMLAQRAPTNGNGNGAARRNGSHRDKPRAAQPAQSEQSLQSSQLPGSIQNGQTDAQTTFRILLCHYPTFIPTAADLKIDLMFSGHTHGGQCRLPGPGRPRPLANSTDLPSHLTSGIFRHQETLCVVSRGLGENILPFRVFCPPHILVYTLHRGPAPGRPTDHVENVVPW